MGTITYAASNEKLAGMSRLEKIAFKVWVKSYIESNCHGHDVVINSSGVDSINNVDDMFIEDVEGILYRAIHEHCTAPIQQRNDDSFPDLWDGIL